MHKIGKIDPVLEKHLVCPKCRNDLVFDREGETAVCYTCSLQFTVNNGIPDMLLEDAEEL